MGRGRKGGVRAESRFPQYISNTVQHGRVKMCNERGVTITCEICGNKFYIGTYSGDYCKKCGQQYDYDEGHFLVLSDEQREFLRKGPELIRGVTDILHQIGVNTKGGFESRKIEMIHNRCMAALGLMREIPCEILGIINLETWDID